MEGASDREVMEQLGHSSIGVTMNIHAHVLDETKREMSSRMNRLLISDDVRCGCQKGRRRVPAALFRWWS